MTLDELTFGGDFRIAQLRYDMGDGTYFRRSICPGEDLSDLPDDARKRIEAEWTPEVIAAYIAETTKPGPDTKRLVLKSVIISRLIAAGKIDAAKAALEHSAASFSRWWAPDRPAINHDDPDALALLTAIGADPAVILAP